MSSSDNPFSRREMRHSPSCPETALAIKTTFAIRKNARFTDDCKQKLGHIRKNAHFTDGPYEMMCAPFVGWFSCRFDYAVVALLSSCSTIVHEMGLLYGCYHFSLLTGVQKWRHLHTHLSPGAALADCYSLIPDF